MTYKEYVDKRQEMMNEVQTLIEAGKLDEADTKMNEVNALDEKWDAVSEAMANMQALSGSQRVYNIQNLTGAQVDGGTVTATMQFGVNEPKNAADDKKEMYASDLYKNAWAKSMMGQTLNAEETNAVALVNDYTHTTKNTGIVIPKTVAAGIWDMVEELYPLWNDIQKTYVTGSYSAIIGDDSTDAKWYEEENITEDAKEMFRELTLSGCELARSVTISWKLREMAVDAFIPYIQRKMARKMGAALGYGTSHGKGKPSANEFKPEPLGIVTALEKEDGTPQISEYTAGKLTFADLTGARAKVKVGANELKIYANSATIWGTLANLMDGNKRPLFIPDPVNNGVYRILGMEIKEDDSMADGEILMSSPFVGYIANVNKEMSMMTEEHVKERKCDYCGYAIVDGGVTTTKAHSLLKLAAG